MPDARKTSAKKPAKRKRQSPVSASAKLGKAMKRLRRERRLSQEDLADLAGLDRTFVSMIERGKRRATLESAAAIASGLGLSLVELIAMLK